MRKRRYDKYDRYWSTGRLIGTLMTDRWTAEEKLKGDYEERRRIFRRFHFGDTGKSRIFIKTCKNPAEARMKVDKHNKMVDFVARLAKILNK